MSKKAFNTRDEITSRYMSEKRSSESGKDEVKKEVSVNKPRN